MSLVRVLALVAFIAVPLVEIYALIQVGQVIGPWWTILILVVDSLIGAWLLRREWRGTWAALRRATSAGQLPNRELADAALVIVGGTLLLTPGFVTDLVGFFFLLPLTRPIARRMLLSFVTRRVQVQASRWVLGADRMAGAAGGPDTRAGGTRTRPGRTVPGGSGPVIQGEVVDQPD